MSDTSVGTADVVPNNEPMQDLAEVLFQYVISLYCQPRGKRPVHAGTAVLLRAHGRDFLVSAAHVLSAPKGLFYYVSPNVKRTLSGRLLRSKPVAGETSDLIDIATLMLQAPGLPPYPDVEKLSGDAVTLIGDETALLDDDIYLATGMPKSRSHANPKTNQIKVEAFSLVSQKAPQSTYQSLKLNPDHHLALVLERAESTELNGSSRVFPDPDGMSGSPVWRLPSKTNGLLLPQLVAILIEFHKTERALVATRIRQVARQMAALVVEQRSQRDIAT